MNKSRRMKVLLLTLSLAFMMAVAFMPAGALAASNIDLDVNVQLLGKLKLLDLVEVKGTCKAITVKVKVGKVTKALHDLGLTESTGGLKIEVPYEIYWYPKLADGNVKGKLVADGKLTVKGDGETITIRYVPAKNPNGPAGVYAVKVKLAVNDVVVKDLVLDAKVKINNECKDKPDKKKPGNDNPGNNNPGNVNPGDNNPDNGNNPGDDHPGNGTSPGNNHQNGGDNNNNGGKLPKTASNYPNGIAVGVGLLLIGLAQLLLRKRLG